MMQENPVMTKPILKDNKRPMKWGEITTPQKTLLSGRS